VWCVCVVGVVGGVVYGVCMDNVHHGKCAGKQVRDIEFNIILDEFPLLYQDFTHVCVCYGSEIFGGQDYTSDA